MTLPNLPDQLRRKLENPAAFSDTHRELAPQYAYGRHRGPAPRFAHQASVIIAMIPQSNNEWSIPLTLRPAQMADHGGQVSLPGGRAESGESVWRTACREFGEELGCSTEYMQALGELTSVYVYASRHRVTPIIGVCSLRPTFKPNPDEVAELIMLPVSQLIADDAISIGTLQRGTSHFDAPGFRIGEHFVWGATAMILGDFRALVKSIAEEQNDDLWFMS